MLIGYARVSTDEQNPHAQIDALTRAGVEEANLYVDHTSGAKSSRPQWDVVGRVLRDGDTLICTRLDRVGRSTAHLVSLLDEFRQRGVAFTFLEQGIDTTTAEGRMVYRMLAAVAEFQKDLIQANTREGLAAARTRGRKGGRKPKLSAPQVRDAQAKYDSREWTVQQIADLYRVPRTTLYNHLTTGTTPPAPEPAPSEQHPPAADEALPTRSGEEQDHAPAAEQEPTSTSSPRRRSPASTKPPAKFSRKQRGRTRYSRAELDAYQLDPVRGGTGEILHYNVLVAGDTLGFIARPFGHSGWQAHYPAGAAVPHSGRGRYAKNREAAVVDLLLGLDITSDP